MGGRLSRDSSSGCCGVGDGESPPRGIIALGVVSGAGGYCGEGGVVLRQQESLGR